MRKFVLIAAMLLASATAQAGQSRGLTLAANDDPPPIAQGADTGPAEAPQLVARPAPIDVKTTPDRSKMPAKPVAKTMRRHHHESTEARVIHELHRYGIYW